MRKHCSNVCELRLCLATESTNSARMRTIVTAAAIFSNGTYFLDTLRISLTQKCLSHHFLVAQFRTAYCLAGKLAPSNYSLLSFCHPRYFRNALYCGCHLVSLAYLIPLT
jgi:hypothetical protein